MRFVCVVCIYSANINLKPSSFFSLTVRLFYCRERVFFINVFVFAMSSRVTRVRQCLYFITRMNYVRIHLPIYFNSLLQNRRLL